MEYIFVQKVYVGKRPTFCGQKCMRNVSRVVDAEAYGDDDDDARHDVDCQAPEVHVTHDINLQN